MTQTTEGTGQGAASNVFPPIYNGQVKFVNLSKEVKDNVNGFPQINIGDNNYTLQLSDAGKHIYATDCTVTVPYETDVAFPIGTQIIIVAQGTSVLVEKDGISTYIYFEGSDNNAYIVNDRSLANLLKTGYDEWYIYGDDISLPG